MQELFNHTLRLRADPSRVVVRPFHIAWAQNGSGPSRSERIVGEVLAMSPGEASAQLEIVLKDFEARHWQTRRVFMTRYDEIENMLNLDGSTIGDEKRQLLGAYFCHEYSYAAAALMNPSAVPHYDQSGMPKGSMRILMSLRAVGEVRDARRSADQARVWRVAHEAMVMWRTPLPDVPVLLREQGAEKWALSLYGSGTLESVDAIMNRAASNRSEGRTDMNAHSSRSHMIVYVLVRTRNNVVNQNGTVVLTYTPTRMIKCRSGLV